jgi:chemosensory pili system protein ChpC
MAAEPSELRAILAPISGGQILLPGSVIAEVIELAELRTFKDAPGWLIGEVDWQDWRVPIVSFAVLSGTTDTERPGARSRVLVIKSLAESGNCPYIGILISGVPRLSVISATSLGKPKRVPAHPCVYRRVTIEQQKTLIPDLDTLAETVEPVVREA